MVWAFSQQTCGEKKYIYTYNIRLMLCISYDLFALVLQYSCVTLPWSSLSLHFNYRPYLLPLQWRTWSCKSWTDRFGSAGAGIIIQNLWFSHPCYFDDPTSIRKGKEREQTYYVLRLTSVWKLLICHFLVGQLFHITQPDVTLNTATLVLLYTIILALEYA